MATTASEWVVINPDHDATSSPPAIIEREDEGSVSLCPEVDVASQGSSIEEARANLEKALSLFFETAYPSEVARRFRSEIFVTQVEVPVG
jgi:predicted RNase H-like HicB family nuclease